MRLTHDEREAILSVFNEVFPDTDHEVRLYGSRADDERRGGDIDLLIIFDDEGCKQKAVKERLNILTKLHEQIGEQKIDLLFTSDDALQTDAFVKLIYPKSIKI